MGYSHKWIIKWLDYLVLQIFVEFWSVCCAPTNLFHFTVFFFIFFYLFRVYWVSTNFSKYFPSFLFLVDFIPIFIIIYWLLLSLQFFADFCQLLPSNTAVNCKFLYTDFRLLSTSIKIEIFPNFTEVKKKFNTPGA